MSMSEASLLSMALSDLAGFNSKELTSDTCVKGSVLLPGGPYAVASMVTSMPEGLTYLDFDTVGEWKAAIRTRIDELDGEVPGG